MSLEAACQNADGQDDPREIPLLLEALGGGADMALGSRFLGRFEEGAITRWNHAGTRFLTAVLNRLFGARLTDPLAGFRALRRNLLDRIQVHAEGYDIEMDLVVEALRVGSLIAEVPVTRLPRRHGRSGLRSIRDGTRILGRLVRARLRSAATG